MKKSIVAALAINAMLCTAAIFLPQTPRIIALAISAVTSTVALIFAVRDRKER